VVRALCARLLLAKASGRGWTPFALRSGWGPRPGGTCRREVDERHSLGVCDIELAGLLKDAAASQSLGLGAWRRCVFLASLRARLVALRLPLAAVLRRVSLGRPLACPPLSYLGAAEAPAGCGSVGTRFVVSLTMVRVERVAIQGWGSVCGVLGVD
jgi:hypothetical protein